MSLQEDIYKLLTMQHTGQPLSGLGDRVYPDILPQNVTYPAATYETGSTDIDYDLGGDGHHDAHYVSVMVSAPTRSAVSHAISVIRASLHAFKGSTFTTAEGVQQLDTEILGIFVRGAGTFYENDTKVYTEEIELEIHTNY